MVVGVALVVALIAWRVSGDDEKETPVAAEATARLVSAAELGDVAAETGHPVYWAGPVRGAVLAIWEDGEGNVQVRYLEDEAQLEEEGGGYLTVGSYPVDDPAGASATLAESPGAVVKRGPGGVRLVATEESPSSVYFASPDNSVQVEVYDPSPRRAFALARSGRVVPAD